MVCISGTALIHTLFIYEISTHPVKRLIWVLLIVMGCLQQGIRGIHYITGEIDSMDGNEDELAEELIIFITFRSRSGEPISFSDAQCSATITYSDDHMLFHETSLSFDSSSAVGKAGGIIIPLSEIPRNDPIDIHVVIHIEGRGTFHWTYPDFQIGT
jgi:hypothetical protein